MIARADAVAAALADAQPRSFWLDRPDAPAPLAPLEGEQQADLAIVGAGLTGLWTALLAKQRDPGREVVVLEARTAGWAASGRNGGFCAASLTHGFLNGLSRFPDEIAALERLGEQNLDGIESTLAREGIECGFERTGAIDVATEPWQLEALRDQADGLRRFGRPAELLDAEALRARVDSAAYLGGLYDRRGVAMVDPARLTWGLRAACLARGVRLYEETRATSLRSSGAGVELISAGGRVRSARAALASNAFAPLLRRIRRYVLPVYDYVLVTEPLDAARRAAIGWGGREGLGDSANQFHYYRLTPDDRILWGGYDAVYYFGNDTGERRDVRPETFSKLAVHLLETFPVLEGVRFTHAWGGAIDTCSRFCPFWGTALAGRAAYVAGYTGLGVGASRFGARVMLDLLDGTPTDLTSLRMVRTRPLPFPPEPLRYGVVALTRRALARADRRQGRRGPWLRLLDRLGLGFDS